MSISETYAYTPSLVMKHGYLLCIYNTRDVRSVIGDVFSVVGDVFRVIGECLSVIGVCLIDFFYR